MLGLGTTELLVIVAVAGVVVCLAVTGVVMCVAFFRQARGRGSLTPCPDCGRGVSQLAVACPQCGRPLR
jgi:predicted amidophosphoribosyltransferase